ncbi:MAG: hypothetical protein ACT4PT_04940 [Methanobacteriota archaeon]
MQAVPRPQIIEAPSEAAARIVAGPIAASTLGNGPWTVRVKLEEAVGTTGPVAGFELEEDRGNAFDLVVEALTLSVTVTRTS